MSDKTRTRIITIVVFLTMYIIFKAMCYDIEEPKKETFIPSLEPKLIYPKQARV